MKSVFRTLPFLWLALACSPTLLSRPLEQGEGGKLLVKKGDLVAVVGDSITEQKRYSRYIEDYLVACVPELDLRLIQLGWSGERAAGFEERMENDLVPLQANVVTTCYGMNDGRYQKYEKWIGEAYDQPMRRIVRRLQSAGVIVVVGSPGAVDTFTFRRADLEPKVYNDNLGQLRDIARQLAQDAGLPFANVHDPMIAAMEKAKSALGDDYDVCGTDGFHPGPNGHLIMAYAFLKAMGFGGDLGTITMELEGEGSASGGHKLLSAGGGSLELESSRYPFCFPGNARSSGSTRSILPFVPFNEELNRLTLVVKGLKTERAKVTWGEASKDFSKGDLEKGINLAAEFLDNPFSEPFRRLDEMVEKKQVFETEMIKDVVTRFRTARRLLGEDAEAEAALATLRRRLQEKERALQAQVRAAVVPVRHRISITPE